MQFIEVRILRGLLLLRTVCGWLGNYQIIAFPKAAIFSM